MQERTRPWYSNRFSDKTAFAGLSRISSSSRDTLELAQSELIYFNFPTGLLQKIISEQIVYTITGVSLPKSRTSGNPTTMSKGFIKYGSSSAPKHEENKVSSLSISVKWQIMLLAWLSSPQTPVPVTDVWCRRAQNWQVLPIFDRNLTQMMLAQLNIAQKEKQNLFQCYRLWC